MPRRQRRQTAAGGGLRWASPPIVASPPDPHLREIPLHPSAKVPDAQNYGSGLHSFRATGLVRCKISLVRFHLRAWFRPAVAEGASRGCVDRNCSENRKWAGQCPAPTAFLTAPFDPGWTGAVHGYGGHRITMTEIAPQGRLQPPAGSPPQKLVLSHQARPSGPARCAILNLN
mgnify:CR=1 FL=1